MSSKNGYSGAISEKNVFICSVENGWPVIKLPTLKRLRLAGASRMHQIMIADFKKSIQERSFLPRFHELRRQHFPTQELVHIVNNQVEGALVVGSR